MAVRPRCTAPLLSIAACAAVVGCARDPLDTPCPDVRVGDLVVTEIRGPQDGEGGYGEWIEVYNGSGQTIDLMGTRVILIKLDGSSTSTFTVRDGQVSASAGDYIVFGRFAEGDEPAYVDYGYASDYDEDLPGGAGLDVVSCGRVIDRVIYRSLPEHGTYSFTGDADPPAADDNDDESSWCTNEVEDVDTPDMGIRGTPGERNPPCG